MKKIGLALAFAAAAFTSTASQAEVIATYDLYKASGTSTPVGSTAAGYTASALTRSASLAGSAFDQHFYFSNWSTVVDPSKYLSLTINRAAAYQLGLMTFSVETANVASSAVYVRSSKDNFSSNLDSFSWTSPSTDVTNGDFDLSVLGNLTGATELRFYFIGSSTSAVTGFANHEAGGSGGGLADVGRDIVINGSNAVPEPSILALLGLGFAGFVASRRKKSA